MKITSIVSKAGKQIFKFIGRMFIFFSKHKELTLILFLSFIIRYFLLDWNSYWLDELYSVYRLNLLEAGDTIKFANVFEFMKFRLARPTTLPLYEFILFNWMSLFGRSEMATRALSTVYVTLSILFIYLFSIK